MKRLTVVLMLVCATLTFGAETEQRRESMRVLNEGRALLESLRKASGFEQAMLAGKVKASFEKAVELDPTNIEARESLAGYYMNAPFIAGGSYKKARRQAEAIAEIDPLRGNILLAEIDIEDKEWTGAEVSLKRAAAIAPADARVQFSLGRVYQEQKRWAEAADAFERAVAADPRHAQSWYQIGRTGALSGQRLDRALVAIDHYIELFADTAGAVSQAGAWWRKGQILEKLGRKPEAEAAYRKSIAIRPDDRVAESLAALRAQ